MDKLGVILILKKKANKLFELPVLKQLLQKLETYSSDDDFEIIIGQEKCASHDSIAGENRVSVSVPVMRKCVSASHEKGLKVSIIQINYESFQSPEDDAFQAKLMQENVG